MLDLDPFKHPTKTALLTTVMLLPHSFYPDSIIEKSSDLEGNNPAIHDISDVRSFLSFCGLVVNFLLGAGLGFRLGNLRHQRSAAPADDQGDLKICTRSALSKAVLDGFIDQDRITKVLLNELKELMSKWLVRCEVYNKMTDVVDFVSPQPVSRKSNGLVEDGRTSMEWLDDSPKKKQYFAKSDEGLDEKNKIIDNTGMKCIQLFWE